MQIRFSVQDTLEKDVLLTPDGVVGRWMLQRTPFHRSDSRRVGRP
jgi:hypothetical protein